MKPILFNTEMVKAILEGRKTVTRRLVKNGKSTPMYHSRDKFYGIVDHLNNDYKNWYAGFYNDSDIFYGAMGERLIDPIYFKAPYKVGDVLYVRESWCDDRQYTKDDTAGIYFYKANEKNSYNVKWRPSIHMPKEAARLFLRVTDVRVERLQDITKDGVVKEGIKDYCKGCKATFGCDTCMAEGATENEFTDLWDSTIKTDQLKKYGWEANPFVWVIEFEVIDKPVEEG